MQVTLGGDRVGSGNKMKVDLHHYERSTHDLGYLWRNTQSPGTLVPFLKLLALPGDTFDIDMNIYTMTHPTVGQLFGSFKQQLDLFSVPIRLYNAKLHNNALEIGRDISKIKFPIMRLKTPANTPLSNNPDVDNAQINPSNLLAYLGVRGIGHAQQGSPGTFATRDFNAIPLLAYWDIYKNYYSNKQEGIGYYIHNPSSDLIQTVDAIKYNDTALPQDITGYGKIDVYYTGATPIPSQILINTDKGQFPLSVIMPTWTDDTTKLTGYWNYGLTGQCRAYDFTYTSETTVNAVNLKDFNLENIDLARESILAAVANPAPFITNNLGEPYVNITGALTDTVFTYKNTQQGLGIKTYQSDIFNNWLSTEWYEGATGISDITAIDTTDGYFTLDTLRLSNKVYNMLMRIAVSGGTYDDWLDVQYTETRVQRAESPIYMGGLIRELAFQEVIANASSQTETGETLPLGSIAGRGMLTPGQKGGRVTIKVDEPSYIMGIVSLTPRLDYSQGNDWDVHLQTMADVHVPALDEIGFQDLITEQMAWWDTTYQASSGTWLQKSAGKQPAWLNYMTAYNKCYGNFAIKDNEMFMTLNRRYEFDNSNFGIKDLTTYIDPAKYNYIFAQTSADAMNFWVQIAVDITARRKMSGKLMPNL